MYFFKVGNISDVLCGRIKVEFVYNMIYCVWILLILFVNDKFVGKFYLGGFGLLIKCWVMSIY